MFACCSCCLALNIGVGCWLYFAPESAATQLPATDAGVPKLVLLSEQEPATESNAAELAAAPESSADLRNDICASIGPFATQADMRGALNALTPLVNRVQYREAHATETRGYWVYLPATSSRQSGRLAPMRLQHFRQRVCTRLLRSVVTATATKQGFDLARPVPATAAQRREAPQ